MKILVAVKRVIDHGVKIHVKPDNTGVETRDLKMSMNPFCEIALEQAVRFKESGQAESVDVVTIGPEACQETLRHALALGADSATLIESNTNPLPPLYIAQILAAYTQELQANLVLLGKQAIDGDNNQTGQMLSGLLGWSQATFASKIDLSSKEATVTRECDWGLETLCVKLPTVITTDLRLNEPRYATLPNIMKAKKKTINRRQAEDFDINVQPALEVLQVSPPAEKKPGIKVPDVHTLVEKLKFEAKVL